MTFRVVSALCATSLVAFIAPAFAQAHKAGPLTLPQALQRAASASPRLTAADRTIGMAEGRREQANALPNPTLGFEVDNFAARQRSSAGDSRRRHCCSASSSSSAASAMRASQAALGDYDAARWRARGRPARAAVGNHHRLRRGALAAQRRIAAARPPGRRARAARAADAAPGRGRRLVAGRGLAHAGGRRASPGSSASAPGWRSPWRGASSRSLMGSIAPDFAGVSGDFGRLVRPGAVRRHRSTRSRTIRSSCAGRPSAPGATPSCCRRG